MSIYEQRFDELEERLRAVAPDCDEERAGMAYHAMRLLKLARSREVYAYQRDFYNVLWEEIASIEQVVKAEAEALAEYEREQELARETGHPL